jgi:hypothetical protein
MLIAMPLASTIGANGGTTVFSEDFEGSFPPTGWTTIEYSGTGTWYQDSYGSSNYEPPGTGTYYAEADSDEYTTDIFDTGLFTPSIDCTGCSELTLTYARNFQDFAGYGYAEVNVYSGGTSPADLEENLWNQTVDDPSLGLKASHNFNPSTYTDPSDVYIEFYYSNEGHTFAWGFYIDDVELSGNCGCSQAEFSATPTMGFTPLEVQFIDETPGDFDTWSWDFGDGGTSTLQNPTHTYETPGPFTVCLAVEGESGCATLTKVDYIHPYTQGVGGEAYPVNWTSIVPSLLLGLICMTAIILLLRHLKSEA